MVQKIVVEEICPKMLTNCPCSGKRQIERILKRGMGVVSVRGR